jgi:hypothetical protein
VAGHVPAIFFQTIAFRILSVIGRNDGDDRRVCQNPKRRFPAARIAERSFRTAPAVGFSFRSPSSTIIFTGVTLPPQSKTGL